MRHRFLPGIHFMPDPLAVASTRGGQVERQFPADATTMTVSAVAGVTGGTLVEATAGDRRCQVAAAGSFRVQGVAMWDQTQNNKVTVFHEGVVEVVATGAIVAGDRLIAAAGGTVSAAGAAPDARSLVGVAMADTANGQKCPVRLKF